MSNKSYFSKHVDPCCVKLARRERQTGVLALVSELLQSVTEGALSRTVVIMSLFDT